MQSSPGPLDGQDPGIIPGSAGEPLRLKRDSSAEPIVPPLPTLADVPLLPRRRLRDGTSQRSSSIHRGRARRSSVIGSSSGGSSRSSSRSTVAGVESKSNSMSRSRIPNGRVGLSSVKRLRGGASGAGKSKEEAVEIGSSDDEPIDAAADGDDVEVMDVDAADVAASFRNGPKKRKHRQGADQTVVEAGPSSSTSAAMAKGGPKAPHPEPAYLPSAFREYVDTWRESHLGLDPESEPRLWSLTNLFSPPNPVASEAEDMEADRKNRKRRYAMIILNQPVTRDDVFCRAWTSSALRICADGGANRLHDHLNSDDRERYLPDLIKGDLDSIRPDVRAYYAEKGVEIKQDKDEYATDLMKCITEVESREGEAASHEQMPVLLLGGLSGRVDQTVHTMSLLHKLRGRRSEVYVLNGESVAWVLDSGSHLIDIDHKTMGQTCGILPVGVDSAVVKTTGLKWDLDGETSMDGLISTSNHLLPENPVVFLKTSRPVLWCVEIKEGLASLE